MDMVWRNFELFQPQNAVPYDTSAVIIAYGREVYQTIYEGQVSIKVQQQLQLMLLPSPSFSFFPNLYLFAATALAF